MRKYDINDPIGIYSGKDQHSMQVASFAESYGFGEDEFDEIMDMQPGDTKELLGCTITRTE